MGSCRQKSTLCLVRPLSWHLSTLTLGAVTLGAFNSRSGRQRRVMNSQIISSPGALQASRSSCLLLLTHLSLRGGDRRGAGRWEGDTTLSLRSSGFVESQNPREEAEKLQEKKNRGLAAPPRCVLRESTKLQNARAGKALRDCLIQPLCCIISPRPRSFHLSPGQLDCTIPSFSS